MVCLKYIKIDWKKIMTEFERLSKILLRPWIAVFYVAFAMVSFFYFDRPIAEFFYNENLRVKFPIIFWLTHAGVGDYYVAGLLLLALCFRYIFHNKVVENRTWFLWLCVMIPYFICGVIKVFVGRARPELWFSDHIYGFLGFHLQPAYWSFPSGHTTTVTGLMCGFVVLFPRYRYLILLLGLLVISTRILLSSHYLSDVLVTAFLTGLEVTILLNIMHRKGWFTDVIPKAT